MGGQLKFTVGLGRMVPPPIASLPGKSRKTDYLVFGIWYLVDT